MTLPPTTTPTTTIAPRPWRARFAALHPNAYLGAHGLVGVVACIVMLWAFSFIADEMTEQSLKREISGRPGASRVFAKAFDTKELFEALQKICGFEKNRME